MYSFNRDKDSNKDGYCSFAMNLTASTSIVAMT